VRAFQEEIPHSGSYDAQHAEPDDNLKIENKREDKHDDATSKMQEKGGPSVMLSE
jgi:hypothetical protein